MLYILTLLKTNRGIIMPYIFITVTAKEELTKLAKKRKKDDSLIKTKIDVASEAIINASKKEVG